MYDLFKEIIGSQSKIETVDNNILVVLVTRSNTQCPSNRFLPVSCRESETATVSQNAPICVKAQWRAVPLSALLHRCCPLVTIVAIDHQQRGSNFSRERAAPRHRPNRPNVSRPPGQAMTILGSWLLFAGAEKRGVHNGAGREGRSFLQLLSPFIGIGGGRTRTHTHMCL